MAEESQLDDATLIELGKLAARLSKSKETRRDFVRAVKKLEPDRHFPDIELEELREQHAKEREDDRIARENERALAAQAAQKRGLSGRYDEAAIGAIEKVMERYGLADYEAGAKLYAADLAPAAPAPAPTTMHGQTWDKPTDKDLLADPTKWARDTAKAAIDEMNARRPR